MLAELFAVFKFGSTAVDAIIPVFTVGRILEAAKDVVLLFTTGQWPQGLSWVLQTSDAIAVMAAQAVTFRNPASHACRGEGTLMAQSFYRSRLLLSQQVTISSKRKSKAPRSQAASLSSDCRTATASVPLTFSPMSLPAAGLLLSLKAERTAPRHSLQAYSGTSQHACTLKRQQAPAT